MKLKRLKEVLNKIEEENQIVSIEEIVGRCSDDDPRFEHLLVVSNKDKVIIKINLKKNQVYYSNGLKYGIKEERVS